MIYKIFFKCLINNIIKVDKKILILISTLRLSKLYVLR